MTLVDETKLAVTLPLAFTVTLHALIPEQLPPQSPKEYPLPGASVSVTAVPWGKLAEHALDGQLIPGGVLVTTPLPVTATVKS
jgi:hypothetical protein